MLTNQTYARMTLHERAQAIAGDMPWITSGLSQDAYKDFVAQIESAFRAVEWQAKLDAIDSAPDPPQAGPRCAVCGMPLIHSRLNGYHCPVRGHEGITR